MLSCSLLQRFRSSTAASMRAAVRPPPSLLQPIQTPLLSQCAQRAHSLPRRFALACQTFTSIPPIRRFASAPLPPPRHEQHLASTLGERIVAAAPSALQPYLKLSRLY